MNTDKQGSGCQVKNLRWLLTRMSNPEEDQAISSWTEFNILIRNDKLVVQYTVGYMPTINAPATIMSRVNEVLTQYLNITETLGLKESVCVFDQVFYVKTADISWKHDQFKNIIFRMEAYHTIPYHTIPYRTVPYRTVPYLEWKHSIPYHTIPYHTIPCRAEPYRTIPYHLKPPKSTIGKRFQDSGLLHLCVGCGVISEGSITDVREGHKYNRVVRLHKIV